jgi:hypothetical protein
LHKFDPELQTRNGPRAAHKESGSVLNNEVMENIPVHVAVMSHGVAGSKREPLKQKGKILQHAETWKRAQQKLSPWLSWSLNPERADNVRMLCPWHCGIVAPVPALLARTADISRLASTRRSYVCVAVTNHTNCNAVKQMAKISSATMTSNPAMVFPWRQFSTDGNDNFRPTIWMCPGSQIGRLSANQLDAKATAS